VWEIATQPYPDAHFATFPEALPERCIKAGCPEFVCVTCGEPRVRIVETVATYRNANAERPRNGGDRTTMDLRLASSTAGMAGRASATNDLGWSDCGHGNYRPGVVLDPFIGSGTTALVARRHGRHTIGIELNPEYAELAARRLSQLSLLAEEQAG
jgi:site-specific DNA-methyltransferase (adenine-specific)